MKQTITNEEIDNFWDKFNPISYKKFKEIILQIEKVISSKKDAECEKRLDKYNDDLIKDLKEMGFNSLSDISFKFKEKDAGIRELKEWKDAEAENHRLKHNECEELKSKLEDKEKEIENWRNHSFCLEHKKILLTHCVVCVAERENKQLQNSIPKSEIKQVLRNICKHKNIDTKNCQVCEAYFQLILSL